MSQKKLGKVIKQYRAENNISQYQFAELAGVERTTISNMERMDTDKEASFKLIRKCAEAMNMHPVSLMYKIDMIDGFDEGFINGLSKEDKELFKKIIDLTPEKRAYLEGYVDRLRS